MAVPLLHLLIFFTRYTVDPESIRFRLRYFGQIEIWTLVSNPFLLMFLSRHLRWTPMIYLLDTRDLLIPGVQISI